MPDFLLNVDIEEDVLFEKLSDTALQNEILRRKLPPGKLTHEACFKLIGEAMDKLFDGGSTALAISLDEIRNLYFREHET